MSTIATFALTPITADQISALDLHAEATASSEPFECYRISSEDTAETGWAIYSAGRAGVAWGGDGMWTNCESAEDAVERFLGLGGKELVN